MKSKADKAFVKNLTFLPNMVGVTGFEPATPCTPCKYSTRLSYTPTQTHLYNRTARNARRKKNFLQIGKV